MSSFYSNYKLSCHLSVLIALMAFIMTVQGGHTAIEYREGLENEVPENPLLPPPPPFVPEEPSNTGGNLYPGDNLYDSPDGGENISTLSSLINDASTCGMAVVQKYNISYESF